MFSNQPTMLQHHDFQARHSDMLAAARVGETMTKEQIAARRLQWQRCDVTQRGNAKPTVTVRDIVNQAMLRVRVPADYVLSDGPGPRRGMSRADFQRAVEIECLKSLTPPPSSQD
jgi:hypothetical protein